MFGTVIIIVLVVIIVGLASPSTTAHEVGHAAANLKHGAKRVEVEIRGNGSGITRVVQGHASRKPAAQREINSAGLIGEVRYTAFCLCLAGFFGSNEFVSWFIAIVVVQLIITCLRNALTDIIISVGGLVIWGTIILALAVLCGVLFSPEFDRSFSIFGQSLFLSFIRLSYGSQFWLMLSVFGFASLFLEVLGGGSSDGKALRKATPAKRQQPVRRRKPTGR